MQRIDWTWENELWMILLTQQIWVWRVRQQLSEAERPKNVRFCAALFSKPFLLPGAIMLYIFNLSDTRKTVFQMHSIRKFSHLKVNRIRLLERVLVKEKLFSSASFLLRFESGHRRLVCFFPLSNARTKSFTLFKRFHSIKLNFVARFRTHTHTYTC